MLNHYLRVQGPKKKNKKNQLINYMLLHVVLPCLDQVQVMEQVLFLLSKCMLSKRAIFSFILI